MDLKVSPSSVGKLFSSTFLRVLFYVELGGSVNNRKSKV